MLLRAGADVSARYLSGLTPLHYAFRSLAPFEGHKEIIESLLNGRSDINAQDDEGMTPLHFAVEMGAVEIMEYLLSHGANRSTYNNTGHNTLSIAACKNRHPVLRMLLRFGIDHTESLTDHGSFMHLVAQRADTETIRVLIGGRLKVRDINIKDKQGYTAF